ncbi:urease accessory protein UreF [Oscillatoria salina]|uniref:urease accessory protein UreF n=1 Tax=Oscillatoria salina TaxID=331517 RepID=UPI0013BCD547|nr:urease accessory protein UreF [Oscillatoria salina]MBZ8179970.1 urease accessory protein UreF [Oscillatoria salina IIICB1]NET86805.1 urease accessory protein UreF [Kamptonema sp. SIO1D9]
MLNHTALLNLLQLASSTLPVGSYSYSEGLEALVDSEIINNQDQFYLWLENELTYGAIRIETAVMLRSYDCLSKSDLTGLNSWNGWLSAARETKELRQQSWQMGQSLLELLISLQPSLQFLKDVIEDECNYAIAFGIAASYWQINVEATTIGYLYSWLNNTINSGVKLIPLGQTTGQKLLFKLRPLIVKITEEIFALSDEELASCSWGLALASMEHETQYSRLFRS